MADWEGLHLHPVVPIHNPRLDLGRLHLIAHLVGPLKPVQAKVDIHRVGRQDVLGHRANPLRSKDLQRLVPLQHPRGKDQVWIPRRMVGVQVGAERHRQ